MPSFLLLNGAAAALAALVATTAQARASTATVLLSALSGYLVAIHSTVLVTGLAGHLTVGGSALVLVAALGVAGSLAWWRRGSPPDRPAERERAAAAALYPVLAAIAAGVLWSWPHLSEATRLWIWDDYTYHMIYPALWLREHAIRAVDPAHAFTMQAWYPLSASVVAAWFMLPFHGMRGETLAWVSLTGPLYGAIAACATAALLERVGCRPGASAVAVVLFATSHRIGVMSSSFSDADLAQATVLFGAFAFAIPRAGPETGRDLRADSWYAALLSGLALGVKVSAAVPATIIAVLIALRARARPRRAWVASAARVGLVFAVGWTVTGGYWYARNMIHTGNPLYPAAFLIWPGVGFPETTLLEYSRRYGLARAIGDALAVYLNWPLLHAAFALAGLAGLAAWLAHRRRRVTRAQASFAAGALAIAAAVLLLLPATPYSAGNAMTFRSGFVHWDSMRYVALLPLLGWAALAFLIDAGAGASRVRMLVAVLVTTAALLIAPDPRARAPVLLIALALGSALASRARFAWPTTPPARGRRDALAVAGVLLLIAANVVWRHHAKSTATAAMFHQEPLFGRAVRELDLQAPGTRVAVFGDQWVFPAFGERDHLVPVRLDRDGRVATAPIGGAMGPGELGAEPSAFVANLRQAGVRVVVVLHLPHPGRSAERPSQERALESSGAARLLTRGPAFTVWAVED